ncbi:MAG: hypothetical protein K5694_05915 [Bacilli bacterium]|nr:hypothetical protein [Bacilli bacterium]
MLYQDFFLNNLWWIIGIAVLLVSTVYFVIGHYLDRRKKEKKKAKLAANKSEYLALLGGAENIVSHDIRGSRIILVLNDYSQLDQDKLKEVGVTGFIQKSDQVTLVVKEHSKEVYRLIFPE